MSIWHSPGGRRISPRGNGRGKNWHVGHAGLQRRWQFRVTNFAIDWIGESLLEYHHTKSGKMFCSCASWFPRPHRGFFIVPFSELTCHRGEAGRALSSLKIFFSSEPLLFETPRIALSHPLVLMAKRGEGGHEDRGGASACWYRRKLGVVRSQLTPMLAMRHATLVRRTKGPR